MVKLGRLIPQARGAAEAIRELCKMISSAVKLLEPQAAAFLEGDWRNVREHAALIATIEREADDLKRRIELNLAKGAFFIGLKEDYMKLVDSLDEVADAAKDASRVLYLRVIPPEELRLFVESCGVELKTMARDVVRCVEHLLQGVELLEKNVEESFMVAHEVEKKEELLDELKIKLLESLGGIEDQLSVVTYLQLKDYILSLDQVADNAERASDVLTLIATKAMS